MPQEHVEQLQNYDPHNINASVTMYTNSQPLQSIDPNTHHPQATMRQYAESVAGSAVSVEVDDKKKKGGATGNATNDKELREMLKRNDGRRLHDVAAEVIATDRTSRAEKSKQLFAMLW